MKPSVLQAVLQRDPQESVNRILEEVSQEVGAEQAALFNIATGKPELFAPATISAPAGKSLTRIWPRVCSQLLSGEVYAEDRCTLVPIGQPPVALLYLVSIAIETAAARTLAADYGDFFEAAILTADQNRLAYLERTSVEQIQRDKTMLLLQRHRWNYSRVAGLLEISRQALHKRLQKYGVCRPDKFSRQKTGLAPLE